MIQKDFCQVQGHNSKQIIGICESKSCIQPSRKVCLKCSQVHEKSDSNFKSDDIKDEFDIQVILDQFKQTNIGMLDNIQLQCQIQQYLLYQELMDLIKTISFKQDYLSYILDQLDEFKSNTWSNISSNDYLLYNDNRGINNYQQKVFNKIIEINDYKDFYLINIAMNQYSNIDDEYSNLDNNILQLFKNIENQKVKLFDSIINSKNLIIIDQQFIQKQRSNDAIITLCEILLDQGQQLDINDMFLQFEKFKHSLLEKVDSHKQLYFYGQGYAKVFNQNYESNYIDALDFIEQSINLNPEYSKSLYLKGKQYNISIQILIHFIGVLIIEEKQFDSALLLFDQAIGIDNLFCDAYNQKGYCLYCLERYLESIEEYHQAIKLDPSNEIYYYNKGNSFHNLHRYHEAIQMYNKAIQLNPYEEIYYYDKGNSLYRLREYQEALSMYDQAIMFNPHNDDYYFSKGKSYHQLQNYQKAIAMYDEAIEIQPKLDQYYYHKGKITIQEIGDSLFESKKYKKASNMYKKAIKINSKCEIYFTKVGQYQFNNQGITLSILKRFEDAIYYYDLCIRLAPSNSLTYFYKELRQYDQAIEMYDQAIRLKYNCDIYYNYRGFYYEFQKGNCYYYQQNYNQGLINYIQVIRLNPSYHIAYCNIANAQIKLKNYKGALKNYDIAIKLSPLNYNYYNEKGQLLDRLNRFYQAIPMYSQAIKLHPNSDQFYLNKGFQKYQRIGCSLYRLKLYQESIEIFDIAISLNPNNYNHYFQKGNINIKERQFPLTIIQI
ncbi:hypothetical protein pb186bvf_002093 [Paramecium bursaria]